MIWKIITGILGLLGHLLSPQESGVAVPNALSQDFTPYPDGPQSFEEEEQAHKALYGQDDILVDDSPSEAGIRDTRYRWPGYPGSGRVPYVIDASLAQIKPLILRAMEQYHKLTCIRFVQRSSERNYINIVKGRGCSSYVGVINQGAQPVNLGDGCHFIGTVVHELGHAVGLYHEHQRSDRNNYITVYDKNVTAGKLNNFDKTDANKELIFTRYDYSSIMHYGNYAFSKQPGRLMTMEAKNGQKLLEPYNKPGFTNSDVETIKKLYKCR